MNFSNAILADDLLLAKLASAKLMKLVQGLLSVGLGSLELEAPDGFLAGRDKPLLAFIEVLQCIGVKPGHDGIEILRRRVEELSALAREFYQHLMKLSQWRIIQPEGIQEAADGLLDSYTQFLKALEAYRTLVGAEESYAEQIQHGRLLIAGFLTQVVGEMGVRQ